MRLFERLDNYGFAPRTDCNIIGTALAIGLGISAAASVGSAAIGAHAAGQAADSMSSAAKSAAELTHEDTAAALDFQKQQYADQKANTAPWIASGQDAIKTLSGDLNSGKYGDFTGQFTAPTAATEMNDPGYAFRLSEGMKALDRGAAARGGLMTGGTAKAEQQYGQDYASNEYNNVYNRAFGQFQDARSQFYQNQNNSFNRYASIAGLGQQANTAQGQAGQAASNNITNISSTDARLGSDALMAGGAARASGYINGANSWMSGINGLSSLALLAATSGQNGTKPNNSTAFPY